MYDQLITVDSLPPLPSTAARLLALAADPDVDIDRLAAAIEQDPPLTARVLGIANSAFYAPRQPVYAVKEAIVRVLGLNMVRNLAFGMAVSGGLSTRDCPHFDLTRYWVMALGTADLASGLARAATLPGVPGPDAAYLVGLLHNLGELALVHLRPQEMDEVYSDSARQPGADAIAMQRTSLGTDQWEVGAMLARHWQLPELVADSIEQLGIVTDPTTRQAMVHLLLAARRWIDGVVSGRSDLLHVVGVDEAYCEYRSSAFVERYDALHELAATLSA